MSFDDRLYHTGSQQVYDDAQDTADLNGAPVAILERGKWLAICEEPPDEMSSSPIEQGWRLVQIVEPVVV